jgi:hypothetical protein
MVDKRESDLIARVHTINDRNVKILAEQKSSVEQVIRQSHAVVTSMSEELKQGQNQWIVNHQSTMTQQVTEQIQEAKNLHNHVEISCDLLHVVEKSHVDSISNTMGDMRSIQTSHFCITPQSNNHIAEYSTLIIQMKVNKNCAFGDKLKDLLF